MLRRRWSAKTLGDVKASKGENVSAIELTVDLVELEMASLPSLMHKMHAKVDMFGTVTATDGTFRPSDACLIVDKYWSQSLSVPSAKVCQELTERDHLLNHRRGRYELSFIRRERKLHCCSAAAQQ
jgi:hypothetical protein